MIDLLHRYTRAVLYTSATADEIAAAVIEARNSGADLSRADLSRADLSRANLSWANLRRADLSGADLSGADLSGANLRRANLSWANLRRADLSRADLSRADLSGADLSGADLSGADLSGANLSWANLSWANLRRAITDENTVIDRWSMTIVGSKHSIVATERGIAIGCHMKPAEWWLTGGGCEFARSNGYTPEEIGEYERHVLQIQAVMQTMQPEAAEVKK